jgi:MFS family permease
MLYNPSIYYMSEWFVARRGLALGVIYAGTATGGLFLPLILPNLIDKYGPDKTLRIFSVVSFVALVPFLPFLKGRLPAAKAYAPTSARNAAASAGVMTWMRDSNFQLLMIANTLQGFGKFVNHL